MTNNAISLCSQACLLLGEDPIESFEEDGDKGTTCGTLYETLISGWLSNYPWSFCKGKEKLSRLADAPLTKWKYAFQLPTARLTADYGVYSTDAIGATAIQDFAIEGDQLLSNYSDMWIDKLSRPDESLWPPYFCLFAIHGLASAFALPLTQDKSLKDDYSLLAFGSPSDNGIGGLYGKAMLTDSQAQPSQIIVQSPLVAARLS